MPSHVIVSFEKLEEAEDKEKAMEELKEKLGTSINKKNMRLYIEAYNKRMDITSQLSKNLKCDALLIVGSKTSHVHSAEHMHQHMDKVLSRSLGSIQSYSLISPISDQVQLAEGR